VSHGTSPGTSCRTCRAKSTAYSANASDVNNGTSNSATADWAPPVDINVYADRFEVFVDLPGVDPKAVEITLDNDVLTLSGEPLFAKRAGEEQQMVRQRSERSHVATAASFFRKRSTPNASLPKDRDGDLELTIAKQAKARPRRITVGS
jgi:HSP20 family protein